MAYCLDGAKPLSEPMLEYIFIQENALENVVCEMASILSRPQCVKGQSSSGINLMLAQPKAWDIYVSSQYVYRTTTTSHPEIILIT